MTADLIAKMDRVAKRWPVEIECDYPRHKRTRLQEPHDLCRPCPRCGASGGSDCAGRLATGADLAPIGPDGWPKPPMLAWWGKYGWGLWRGEGVWAACTAGLCGTGPYATGHTPAGAMQAAAIAELEATDD